MMRPCPLVWRWIGGWVLGVAVLLWGNPAHAHRVIVFAWVEGDTVHTESTFSNGRTVHGGTIEVYDAAETLLLKGTTDDQGRFAFPVPAGGDLKVVVQAGMGHTAQWIVGADETDRGSGPAAATSARTFADAGEQGASTTDAAGTSCVDARAVEQIVRKALDNRFAAMEARLAAQQPSQWRDVVAGLGYILGLVGLVAYMRHRKDTRK